MQLTSTDGAAFELRLTGYEYPTLTAPGDWDANWLNVHGQVRTAAGESWTFHDPSLTTWEARDLHRWLQAAAEGLVEPTDTPGEDLADVLTFTEPNLAFSVAAMGGQRDPAARPPLSGGGSRQAQLDGALRTRAVRVQRPPRARPGAVADGRSTVEPRHRAVPASLTEL